MTQRIANGPQILCRMCGVICNHVSGLCRTHRRDDEAANGMSKADSAYLEWKKARDGEPRA